MGDQRALTLESFEEFRSHPQVQSLLPRYRKDAILADYAITRLIGNLRDLNEIYRARHGRPAFATLEGRVKTEASFFRKLYLRACERTESHGLTPGSLERLYRGIKDLSGVRFSCPYLDEVRPTIADLIRPGLAKLGYATQLKAAGLQDRDFLDPGNEHGYRSYHFHVKVPTPVDIFGNTKLCLCEIQAKSELQHVWAAKSHDLLYKPEEGWLFGDQHVEGDMRAVSDSLKAADQHLVSSTLSD